ncbi:TIGR01777 family oxidoreductase [Sanguibacter sp. HDW7]|uniref:TIGR01777 family oxidoreductase n=1 Tax=Sanguibacter sp. HDW7 TaxID=2714931 RepID=UPI00140731AD|nr:TIGR01777 family oxidoreductase [Sanguibacter sp. HDW7]QIK84102.1 TIGR01777 family protein [Sanguibacter sp. HDW7]
MRVLVAGASGMIGTRLVARLRADGHDVRALVRREPRTADERRWDPEAGKVPDDEVATCDALVNLAGAPLARLPWTNARRAGILESRVLTTTLLADAVAESPSPPSVWLNASAVGIYGDRPGERLTEASARGTGFLADVVDAWEGATAGATEATRVVLARTGLVLGPGGALAPLRLATRLGVGARVGPGRQGWPWISLADEIGAMVHLLTSSQLAGPVNLVGLATATSEDVTRSLARALHRPHLLVLPRPVLRLALQDAADDLLLADQAVVPERLLADGFVHAHRDVRSAVEAALTGH